MSITAADNSPAAVGLRTRRHARDLLTCRICQRILAIAVLAIAVIEIVILIPSIQNFEQDALAQIESRARTAVAAFDLQSPEDSTWTESELAKLVEGGFGITGAALHRLDVPYPEVVGEVPTFAPQVFAALGTSARTASDGARYEILISPEASTDPSSLVLRLNSEVVADRASAFLWRVLGLVLVIAGFVGATIAGAVWTWIVQPILSLRDALIAARREPLAADRFQIQVDHKDEIGEILREANHLLVAISGNYRDDAAALSMLLKGASDLIVVYDKVGKLVFTNGEWPGPASLAHGVLINDMRFARAGVGNSMSVSDLLTGTSFRETMVARVGEREFPCELIAVRVRFGAVALIRSPAPARDRAAR